MKTWKLILIAAFASALTFLRADAETYTQTQKVAFSNPQQPGTLRIESGKGDVTVAGYNGREVVIDVTTTNENALPEEDEKAKGMRRITGSSFGITKNTDENSIVITPAKSGTTDMTIKVPAGTSLKIGEIAFRNPAFMLNGPKIYDFKAIVGGVPLGILYDGDISVEDVTGDMEIAVQQGDIMLRGVSGGMTVSTMAGDITAVFDKVSARSSESSGGNPIAFSATDGDIDVTFPSDVRATVTAKNVEGDIYTDHDMEIVATVQEASARRKTGSTITVTPKSTPTPPKAVEPKAADTSSAPQSTGQIEESERQRALTARARNELNEKKKLLTQQLYNLQFQQSQIGGAFFGNSVTGTINGGGSDVQLTTLNGNIYIRKAK